MRETLFKAKRTDNGEWVEGFYCKEKTGYYDNIGFHEQYKDCIIISFSDGGIIWVDVDSSTLCQYTGFHDRTKWEELSEKEQKQFLLGWNYEENRENQKEDWKGKKIWENDIILDKGKLFVVVWSTDCACFMAKPDTNIRWAPCINTGTMKYVKVIGNIFDNPELLEQEG